MMNNKIDTDKAWLQLYQRLDDDGLLEQQRTTRSISLVPALKWVAAIVAFICVSAVAWKLLLRSTDMPTYTLRNADKSLIMTSTLEDGSIVFLKNGFLTCPQHFEKDQRLVHLRGEALFDVNTKQNQPFTVETGPSIIQVLGTAFSVKTSGTETFELSVQRGKVRVTLKSTGSFVDVVAGETVILADNDLQKHANADEQQFEQYTDNLHFKDERLDNVVRVINKLYPEFTILVDNSISSRALTFTFSGHSPQTMVEYICIALNLKYTEDGKTISIHE